MKVPWKWLFAFFIGPPVLVLIAAGILAAVGVNLWFWIGTLVACLIFPSILLWAGVRLLTSQESTLFFEQIATWNSEDDEETEDEQTDKEDDSEGKSEPDSDRDVLPLLRYLRQRMDFIAQITTSAPSWSLPMSWKEVTGEFTDQGALLDNIARSHEITGEELSIRIKPDSDSGKAENVLLQIPHGHIGVQAFYSILENLIRNAAKYGNPKDANPGGDLRFTVRCREVKGENPTEWQRNFYRIEIEDNLETGESVVEDLNEDLSADIIDPITGALEPGSWGMKEIKISAAYLRMVRQEDIDHKFDKWKNRKPDEPPIAKAFLKDKVRKNGKTIGRLTYVFYMLKSKYAMVVTENMPNNEKKKEFERRGIDFISVPKEEETLSQRIRDHSLRHDFLVLSAEHVDWEWLAENVNALPYRIFITGGSEEDIPSENRDKLSNRIAFIENNFDMGSPDAYMEKLWECWVQKWWGNFTLGVQIDENRLESIRAAEEFIDESDDESETLKDVNAANLLLFDHNKYGSGNATDGPFYRESAFHYCFDGNDSTHTRLRENERSQKWRVKEAAALSVAVMDERIWPERENKPSKPAVDKYLEEDQTMQEIWRRQRVHLLDSSPLLASQSEEKMEFETFVVDEVRERMEDWKLPSDAPCDFLIIHQGIIDEVEKEEGEEALERGWKRLEKDFRWIVIDTGRGQANQAREKNLRSLDYSNLAECMVRNAADKFQLVTLLFALRSDLSDTDSMLQ